MQLQSTVLAEIKMSQFRKPQLAEINITAKEHISYFLHYFTLIENTEYEHAGQFGGRRKKFCFWGGGAAPLLVAAKIFFCGIKANVRKIFTTLLSHFECMESQLWKRSPMQYFTV